MKKHVFILLLVVSIFTFAFAGTALAATISAKEAFEAVTVDGDSILDNLRPGRNYDLVVKGKNTVTLAITLKEGYSATIDAEEVKEAEVTLPNSGSVTMEIVVNATESEDSSTFKVRFSRATATLENLTIEGLTTDTRYLRSSGFDPEEFDYSLEIESSERKLELNVDSDYDVDVFYDDETDGVSDEGKGKYEINLREYSELKPITIVVSETGYQDGVYEIDLERIRAKEGTLRDIRISTGDSYSTSSSRRVEVYPNVSTNTSSYHAFMPYEGDGESITLRISVRSNDDYVEIEGDLYDADDKYVDYTLEIDADDQVTVDFTVGKDDYSVTIYQAARNASDDATLKTLRLQTSRGTTSSARDTALELSPSFSKNTTKYAAAVDRNRTLYIYPDATDSAAFVLIDGVLVDDYYEWEYSSSNKTVEVVVIAEDCEETETYTVELGDGISTVATLRSLTATGNNYATVNLSPVFKSDKLNYTSNVSNAVTSISLNALASSSDAVVRVSANGGGYTTINGSSGQLNLATGLNEFRIQVTASGNTNTYYLYVYRQAANPNIAVSNQRISIDGGTATPIAAYNINGNNFLKLRDVAQLLNRTQKSFSVTYSEGTRTMTLVTGGTYTPIGGELVIPTRYSLAVASSQRVYLDNGYVTPMAYNIDGNNYFLLRDLALLLDFGVDYSNGLVSINTSRGYVYSY